MAIKVGQCVKVCFVRPLRSHPVHDATGVVKHIVDESAWVEFTPPVQMTGRGIYDGLWLGLNTLLPIHPRMPISPIFLQEANDATV